VCASPLHLVRVDRPVAGAIRTEDETIVPFPVHGPATVITTPDRWRSAAVMWRDVPEQTLVVLVRRLLVNSPSVRR